jgi:hypothetical protein
MLRLVIATLSLMNSVLLCLGFVKLNLVLVGLWQSTKKMLHSHFLILEVRDIPQQLHKPFSLYIHGKLTQLEPMEFLNFVIIILL